MAATPATGAILRDALLRNAPQDEDSTRAKKSGGIFMRRIVGLIATILTLILHAPSINAQTYPSRTVTIIVPYPAGGPTDQLARQIAPALAEKLGQNFIVEN